MTYKILYTYTQQQLLDQPEYYMFSAYYGKAFLRGYFENRAAYVGIFEQRYIMNLQKQNQSALVWLSTWRSIIEQNGSLLSKDIQLIHSQLLRLLGEERPLSGLQSIAELETESRIDTSLTLRLLLQIALGQNEIDRERYLFWLIRFLKRFEISKKLYSAYQPSMKVASNDYRDCLNYALLSLALLYDYEWAGNLKMLNTALKLNDLLCSQSNELKEPEALLATILTVHKERSFIQQIMTDKGVTI